MKYQFSPAKNPRVLMFKNYMAQLINNDQKIIFENIDLKNLLKMLFLEP